MQAGKIQLDHRETGFSISTKEHEIVEIIQNVRSEVGDR